MPEPVVSSPDSELHSHVERALAATYELDREIGRGGMGIVYRARDRRLKRAVAVKVLPPELAFRSEIRTRFLREAETAAQLSHPNIVPIYSVDEAENFVFFVMACIDGDNLGKRLHDRGPLPVDDVRRILGEVADALAYAHERGVVHRDIKPDNILLDTQDRALVTDFGIARAVIEGSDSRLTATGMAIGTPAYMSPEQSAGEREVDGRSDLYSLGVVAYQMLAGSLPFTASSTPAMLVKHLSERPVPVNDRRPDVPADLAATVMRLLEKEPADRIASAAELSDLLERHAAPVSLTGAATRPHALPVAPQPAQPPRPGYEPVGADLFEPSAIEMARWNAPPVVEFRGRVGKYLIVNAVILLCAIILDTDFLVVTAFWSVFMAFKYAKLWSDGFDWRDVFKQPRDRLLFDVVAETVDETTALFDRDKRAAMRERTRSRLSREARRSALPPAGRVSGKAGDAGGVRGHTAEELARLAGPYATAVRDAATNRDEILRVIATMPKAERDRISDVGPSATALAAKIQDLAVTAAELDRNAVPDAAEPIEREIARLEAEANPLDRSASEERVKRLAFLKRQRRAVSDVTRRRDAAVSRLESCRIALQNMKLDVVRLRAGGGMSHLQVTSVAEQAMALAREVDNMVYAADEIAKVGLGSRSRA